MNADLNLTEIPTDDIFNLLSFAATPPGATGGHGEQNGHPSTEDETTRSSASLGEPIGVEVVDDTWNDLSCMGVPPFPAPTLGSRVRAKAIMECNPSVKSKALQWKDGQFQVKINS